VKEINYSMKLYRSEATRAQRKSVTMIVVRRRLYSHLGEQSFPFVLKTYRNFYYDTGRTRHMGKHSRSENGSGAWVALCAHLSHTDTDRSAQRNVLKRDCTRI
jgi:hypothetical protein